MWFKLLPLLFTLFLKSDPPADPPTGDPPVVPPVDEDDEELGDGGKSALRAERAARKKADSDLRDLKTQFDELQRKIQADEDAKAEEDGEYRKLADERKTKLDEANDSLTTLRTENDDLKAYVTADIAKSIEALPAALLKFDPGEDAPLTTRLKWLTSAKEAAAELPSSDRSPGNPPNPDPSQPPTIDIDAEVAKQRNSKRYRL